jgi:hypothetical protein
LAGNELRRIIPATELFTTFRQHILGAAPQPKADVLVEELCRDAATLRKFETLDDGSVEAIFRDRLQNLDTTTVMPLVLLLLREPAVSELRRKRALQALESWLVRRAVMRMTAKNYNQQVASMLEKVGANPEVADDVIIKHLRGAAGEATRWPSDEGLVSYVETHNAYGNIAQNRLAMVFAAIERSLYTSKVEALAVPSGLSVEHLMPQHWEKHWPLPDGLPAVALAEAKQAREQHIHRLGNLTVTTLPLNASLSNSSWSTKRGALNKGSKLLINTEVVENHPVTFDEDAIDDRTRLLSDRICQIWPGPASSIWGPSNEPYGADEERPKDRADCGSQGGTDDRSPGAGASNLETGDLRLRTLIRDQLRAGVTPDAMYATLGGTRHAWLLAIEEEAKLANEFAAFGPTPENVVDLRDNRNLRWERIAVRVLGDPRKTSQAKELYDLGKNEGAARRSYTGRGRRFPEMDR